jgi:hypothetical protein
VNFIVTESTVPYSPIMKKYGKEIVSMMKERMKFHKASFAEVKEAFKSLFNNIVESDL